MKKLYLISALFASFLLSEAQPISITVEGEPVEQGATVDCYNIINNSYEFKGMLVPSFSIDPEVKIASTQEVEANVTVTNTSISSLENLPIVSFCWTTVCETIKPGKSVTKTDIVSTTPGNLFIDVLWDYNIEEKFEVTCRVDVEPVNDPTQTFSFNINMIYDPLLINGIEDVIEEDAPVLYYDLMGRRIYEPHRGQLVIECRGAKTSKKIF